MVDVVTVSTKTLAKVVAKRVQLKHAQTGREIPLVVAENRIYPPVFAQPRRSDGNIVRVGWAGSTSHIGDLELVTQPLLACARDYSGLEIQFRGCSLPAEHPLKQLSNFDFRFGVRVAEYTTRMPLWDWDIALAPLTKHDFNQSKSCIKMVEAGWCGIPCLASWARPYEEFCHWDKDLEWLLCAGSSAFERKLRALICDIGLRREYGAKMKAVTSEHYQFQNGEHEAWRQAIDLARAS